MIRIRIVLSSLAWLIAFTGAARPDDAPTSATLPWTAGFADTRGGAGGRIVRVTNLDAVGTGSLRAAIEMKGPRTIVFEVGGVVDLDCRTLTISQPFLTVAGQTAPSPGVTLIRGSVLIATHDVIVQHLRVRPGDAGRPKGSGWEPDAISTSGGNAYNIVIDHCSTSWAVDENLSVSGPRLEGPEATSRRVTLSNCIISEGLDHSTHAKGRHSKGSLIHDFCQDVAVFGNLYAHNVERNPYFKAHTTGVIVNNVIYNPGTTAIQLGFSREEWEGSKYQPRNARVSIIGNVFIHGHDTRKGLAMVASWADAYLEDNRAMAADGKPVPLVKGAVVRMIEKPVWPAGLEPLPSHRVVYHVVHHAGARPRDRDATDARIAREVVEGGGRVIDSQDDVEGYPQVEMTRRALDIPEQDVEAWLDRMAKELEEVP